MNLMTSTVNLMTTTPMTTTDDWGGALEAVAASLGLTLIASRQFHSEATGEGFTTGHEVDVEAADGSRETQIVYAESHPRGRERPGVLRLRDDDSGQRIDVWLYPRDPRLPALAAAVFPAAAGVLLERLGLDATGLALEIVAYRPGKRAVVRMTTATGILYLKVVKPEAVDLIRSRHELWQRHGLPVPGVRASASDGIVVLDTLPGVEAIGILPGIAAGDAFLDALDRLVARINSVPSETAARASLVARLDWYRRRLEVVAPDSRADLERTRELIAEHYARGGPPPSITVHGDLHLGQVFVDPVNPTEIVGVLDIDTAGLGDPADDAAALVAHLLVTAEHRDGVGEPGLAETARSLADRSRRRWARVDDPGFAARATAITATHLLGHALSGSVSVPTAVRLSAAVFADFATSEDESALTTASHSSHTDAEA